MLRIAGQEFPGVPRSAGAARRFVAGQVGDTHIAEAVALVVDELACNAIQHSRSGAEGGTFTVCVEVATAGVRVDVADQGGAGKPIVRPLCADADDGRGLCIVDAIASTWGVVPHRGGLRVWARVERNPAPGTQAVRAGAR